MHCFTNSQSDKCESRLRSLGTLKNSSIFTPTTNPITMHTKITILLTLAMLWSCSHRQVVKSSTSQNTEPIKIEVNYKSDRSVEFVITNQSDSLLNIFEHYKLAIERQDGENWLPLRILHCPCGAPCAKPAEFIVLEQGESLKKSWNLEESWCGEITDRPVPETITQPVSPGIYRIKMVYSFSRNTTKTTFKEFTLKQ